MDKKNDTGSQSNLTEFPLDLTDSQLVCLRLVGEGMSSKEIAYKTGLTPRTVDQYVNRAQSSLGASNRREAARKLALLETEQLNKFQLKSQHVASSENSAIFKPVAQTAKPMGSIHKILKWLPPIGGERHDLVPAQRIEQIIRAAVIAFAGFAGIVATAAWLQTLSH